MEKILELPLKSVTKLIQDKSVNVLELTKACLKKAKDMQDLNAIVQITEKKALKLAESAARRQEENARKSALDGIPIVVKDNFCVNGTKTTCASTMLESFESPYDATVYKRLQDAGAVLIGKANMDQFAMGSGTVDSLYGPSKNPWGYKRGEKAFFITGGSSGGSAAAVAANMCFGALGSDTGGSVRNPASYCGLIGLKPTYGLLSRHGLIPLSESLDCPGILTKCVDDCLIMFNSLTGYDKMDSTSLRKKFKYVRLPPAERLSTKGLKVGIPVEYYHEHLSNEMLEVWNETAKILEDSGATVEQMSMPNTDLSNECYTVINQCEIASNMARYDGVEFGYKADDEKTLEEAFSAARSKGFSDVVKNRIICGNYFLLAKNHKKYFEQALKVRRLILDDFHRAFEEYNILLTPTTLTSAPDYHTFISKANREQCAVQDYCTQPVNMAGVPAISVPIKLSKTGMPLSIQIIAKKLTEPLLLAVAKYIEHKVNFNNLAQK